MKKDHKTTETVLLVDDEDIVVETSKELLQALGFEVLMAKDGQEAVRLCRENKERIGLAIVDLLMPGMSGVDTGRVLKQINPDIKIFLSSGYPLDSLTEKTAISRYEGFLEKPFGIEALNESLKEVME